MSPAVLLYAVFIACSPFNTVTTQESVPGTSDPLCPNDDSFSDIDYPSLPSTPGCVPSPSEDDVPLTIDFSVRAESGRTGNDDDNNENGNGSGDGNGDGNSEGNGNGESNGEGNNQSQQPFNLTGPSTSRPKRSKKSKRRSKHKRRSGDDTPVPVPAQQFVATNTNMGYHPINTPIYARTENGILRGGEWERSIIPEDRLIDPVDLSTMKEVSLQELKEWAGLEASDDEGDRRMLVNQEKAAKKYKEGNYCVFECAYKDCPNTYTDMKALYNHVVGYKRMAADRYLYVACEARIAEDGLNPKKINLKQRPTRFPWGLVKCIVPERVTHVTDEVTGIMKECFDVPEAIQTQWDEWMVDERNEKEKAIAAINNISTTSN